MNPYLDEFLQFYSQAEHGNGLTRGLETDLAKKTYIKTLLDEKLTPAILAENFVSLFSPGMQATGKRHSFRRLSGKQKRMMPK
jgi:hypothetical protein